MLKALKLSELTNALDARLIAADASFDGVSIASRVNCL
jgi:UDP-N-acetylmuramoyl-tripeptide--D-alanyl-D-alanine ligase